MANPNFTVVFRRATPEDAHLPWYDYTKLSADNQCPTKAILRYGLGMRMPGEGRAMPLEAGKLLHDAFAVVRLTQLHITQGLVDHTQVCGLRLFGKDRWEEIYKDITNHDDERGAALNACITALNSGGYIDSPDDKRRTISHMENTITAYVDRWDWDRYPIWVEDERDASKLVGIEVPFDIRGDIVPEGVDPLLDPGSILYSFRLTGRLDGLHWDGERRDHIVPQENKSGGRMDKVWAASMLLSHQVTGYVFAAELYTGLPCREAVAIGAQLPLPKLMSDGIHTVNCSRKPHHIQQYMQWLIHTLRSWIENDLNPYTSPKNTGACSAYFRICSFMPFCHSDDEEKEFILNEMVYDPWSPLVEEVVGD